MIIVHNAVTAMDIDYDNLFIGCEDGTIEIHNVSDPLQHKALCYILAHASTLRSLKIIDESLYSCGDDMLINVWNLQILMSDQTQLKSLASVSLLTKAAQSDTDVLGRTGNTLLCSFGLKFHVEKIDHNFSSVCEEKVQGETGLYFGILHSFYLQLQPLSTLVGTLSKNL